MKYKCIRVRVGDRVVVEREHRIVAERVLGRPLPAGACVHHVDEDKGNNANQNLVICQDDAYHNELHRRARILRAGGNPNTDKYCNDCKRVLPPENFSLRSYGSRDGRVSTCRPCNYVRRKRYPPTKKAVA